MGILFDALTLEDRKKIERYIDYNAEVNREVSLDYILREWDREKVDLYNLFGQKFILSKEIELTAIEGEMINLMSNTMKDNSFIKSLRAKFDDVRLESNRRTGDWDERVPYYVFNLLDAKRLYHNEWDLDGFSIYNPKDESKPIKIATGMKVTKALSKLADAYNIEGFEEFRINHSQVLNKKHLTGNLCLSIHPLDFMTMSDNNCGWESCMSWRNNGCYRQGTIEMMNSRYVLVAYLTASEDMSLTYGSEQGMRWNNKKWRELYVVSDEIITSVKPYPYFNDELSKIIVEWLKELKGADKYGPIIKYDAFEDVEYDNRVVHFVPETYNMYNDFDNGANPTGTFANDVEGRLELTYSGRSECMSCGSLDPYFESEGCLCCEDCYHTTYCEICGDAMNEDYDEVYYVDNHAICRYCYENDTVIDFLGETHLMNNIVYIYLADEQKGILKGSENRIPIYYDDFNNKRFMKKYFTRVRIYVEKGGTTEPVYYVYKSDFVDFESFKDEVYDYYEFDPELEDYTGEYNVIENLSYTEPLTDYWYTDGYISNWNERTKHLVGKTFIAIKEYVD